MVVEAYPILSETTIGIDAKSKGRLNVILETRELSVPEDDARMSYLPVPEPPLRVASVLEEISKLSARVEALS